MHTSVYEYIACVSHVLDVTRYGRKYVLHVQYALRVIPIEHKKCQES